MESGSPYSGQKRKRQELEGYGAAKGPARGVVYLSRIPPNMKPARLRRLLGQHGEVTRCFLQPEDPAVRRQRHRQGGTRGKQFTEGWVEFGDKRDAKRVARLLHGEQIGGKKRSAHYHDLWTLRYLPRFQWAMLAEEGAYQRAVRGQQLAAEVAAARRERDFYLQQVDKAKKSKAIMDRRAKK